MCRLHMFADQRSLDTRFSEFICAITLWLVPHRQGCAGKLGVVDERGSAQHQRLEAGGHNPGMQQARDGNQALGYRGPHKTHHRTPTPANEGHCLGCVCIWRTVSASLH